MAALTFEKLIISVPLVLFFVTFLFSLMSFVIFKITRLQELIFQKQVSTKSDLPFKKVENISTVVAVANPEDHWHRCIDNIHFHYLNANEDDIWSVDSLRNQNPILLAQNISHKTKDAQAFTLPSLYFVKSGSYKVTNDIKNFTHQFQDKESSVLAVSLNPFLEIYTQSRVDTGNFYSLIDELGSQFKEVHFYAAKKDSDDRQRDFNNLLNRLSVT
jgi:hypothetical protein